MSSSYQTDIVLPPKPPLCTEGDPILVTSNLFPLQRSPRSKSKIFLYDVRIEAAKPKTRTWKENLKVMKYFLEHEVNYGASCAYDGQALLYSSERLPFDRTTTVSFKLPPGDDPHPSDFRRGPIRAIPTRVQLMPVSAISMEHTDNNQINELLSALNTVIRYYATLTYPSNKKVFYPVGGTNMKTDGAAKILRSWFTTTRLSANGIALNVDTSSIKMLDDGNLVRVACGLMNWNSPQRMNIGPNGRMARHEKSLLQRTLKKIKVQTNHNPEKTMSFPIAGISDKNSETYTFQSEGQNWNIASYMQAKYRITLQYPWLPVVSKSKTVFLPMEILDVCPGQIHPNKSLSASQTKDMMDFCKVNPTDRIEEANRAIEALAPGKHVMDEFGYEIGAENIVCTGRQLKIPRLEYSEKKYVLPDNIEGDWERDSFDMQFFKPASIKKWKLIAFGTRDEYGWLDRFIPQVVETCNRKGMVVPHEPEVHFIRDENGRKDEIQTQLRAIWDSSSGVEFLLAVSRFEKSTAYTAFKNFCDVYAGVPSQFFIAKKAQTAKGSYFSNLSLKLNVKAGGINQTLGTAVQYFKEHSICFGIDVTYSSPGTSGSVSLAGIVSNVDQRCSQFIGSEIAMAGRQDVISSKDQLKAVIKRHLRAYYDRNKKQIPKKVLYLRDGVSDSQYKHVLDVELLAIKEAYTDINQQPPKVTFVVGQKRHHVRFAPKRGERHDESGNVPSNTVIDSPEVTRPDQFEFYAFSHSGLLGTSRPCRYVVIHDDFGFNVDSLSKTIFATSHTYQCATRAVSLPTPVYYAQKLADRARLHLSDPNAWTDEPQAAPAGGPGGGPGGYRGGPPRGNPRHAVGRKRNYDDEQVMSLQMTHASVRNTPYFV
ncbi:hypothetical protein E3P99_03753 [Wallemia hederae]|uniref:Piwi domain-containing protein n=1 Tax=Wallemia hederae TaxID=1540922 RepID=A0A4T0FDF2_9BASI|nr:hypothetical protein E3P99_03753 [Wallemia hederae]